MKHVECPVCGIRNTGNNDTDQIAVAWVEMYAAHGVLWGTDKNDTDRLVIRGESDACDYIPPSVNKNFMCCNNALAHPDQHAHWWEIDSSPWFDEDLYEKAQATVQAQTLVADLLEMAKETA